MNKAPNDFSQGKKSDGLTGRRVGWGSARLGVCGSASA